MTDEELQQMRDDVRAETVVRAIEDLLWRFNEVNEGTLTVYDLLGFVAEDLVKEGLCGACISETLAEAFARNGVNLSEHRNDDGERPVFGDRKDDVFH